MRLDPTLLRLAGFAALAGALLRLVAAFPAIQISGLGQQSLYFAVDGLLTLGLIGLMAGTDRLRTWLGALGFVGAILGFELIRTGDQLGGEGGYQRGAAVLSLALAIMGLALVRGQSLVRHAGWAWLASFAVGLAGSLAHQPVGFLAASLLFCLGFAIGGVVLLRGGGGRV